MTRAATARRLATGAAVSGGGVGLAGVALYALLREEARAARRKVEARTAPADPPSGDGIYGRGRGKPLVLTVLGDSSAVGLGVDKATETPGVLVAAALAELAERPVRLVRLAVSGAVSRDLHDQVDKALAEQPDIALIMIGANDVTSRTRPTVSVRHLAESVRRLTDAGCEVVVGTCPDLGTIRPIAQPLRTFARRWSRAHGRRPDRRGRRGRRPDRVAGLGPRPGVRLRPQHVQRRRVPSQRPRLRPGRRRPAPVRRRRRRGLAGARPRVRPIRRGTVRPVAQAAARAASRTGTEVQPAEVRGSDTGPRGPWALLRRRKPTDLPTPEEMEESAETSTVG